MDIAYGNANDLLHNIGREGYEWWYYDIVANDGEYAITCIFFRGIPMLPKNIKQRIGNNLQKSDSDGLSLSIYHKGRKIAQKLLFSNNHTLHFAERDGCNNYGIFFAKCQVSFENGQYRIFCDCDEGQDSKRITVNAVLTDTNTLKGEKFERNSQHLWSVISPHLIANVQLSIFEKDTKKINESFDGYAYHDHNVSPIPIFREFNDWYWGRSIFHDRTFVFYYIPMSDKHAETVYASFFEVGNTSATELRNVHISVDKISYNYCGLKSGREVKLIGYNNKNECVECTILNTKAIENGPFYQRFLSKSTLKVNNSVYYDNNSIAEYFNATRLLSPVVRMFIKLPWVEV